MNKFALFILPIIGGFLSFLAWSEFPLYFLIFIAWCPLLFIEDYFSVKYKNTVKLKLLIPAFLFFFSWNLFTTYWLFFASPIGTVCALVANSLLMCVPFLLFHQSKKKFGSTRGYFSLIAFWMSFEYLHQYWDLSWSWLNLGNVFSNFPALIQWYEYTGSSGGTLWVLLFNLLIFSQAKKIAANPPEVTNFIQMIKAFRSIVWKPALLLFAPIFLSLIIYSTYSEKGDDVEVVVIQPNIDPHKKFNGDFISLHSEKLFTASKKNLTENTDYILLPETAIPQYIYLNELETYDAIKQIRKIIGKFSNLNFITGAGTLYKFGKNETLSKTARALGCKGLMVDIHNSALQINKEEEIQIYHKSKLVPGAEKMPFSQYFPFLDNLLVDLGGIKGSLVTQEERAVFSSKNGLNVAPIICYESIYGEYIADYVKNGADLLFILTNDAWWGNTAGHKQHLHYASLRAIETRRSIARSANTGISCFINQRGDIIQASKYGEEAALIGNIKSNDTITVFVKYGDVISRLCLAVSILFLLKIVFRSR